MQDRLYSAVVESTSEYFFQARRLVWSLTNEAGVPVNQIVLHSIAPVQRMQYFTSKGIKVVQVEPFAGNPWCNKLQQLDSLAKEDFADVVLLDTDTLVLEDPPRIIGSVQAKMVDFSNPPTEILKSIYEEANITWKDGYADIDGSVTSYANANGGVYVMDKDSLLEISERWKHWANWLMKRKSAFGQFWWHIDQVSFAMAVAETGVNFEELDRRYNFPTQNHQQPASLDRKPAILHYHNCINNNATLKHVGGLSLVNYEIDRLNNHLADNGFHHSPSS